MTIRRWGITEGEFISDADIADANRVVLLGAKVAGFPRRRARPDRGEQRSLCREGLFIEMGARGID
jgi:hypothetical protein